MFSHSNIELCPNNIYYNCTMFNSSVKPQFANYNETRTSPLLHNPSHYYLSVIRFNIPGEFLPIFIAQALPYPNTNPNTLIYTVTLTRNGTTSGPVNLVWDPNYNTVDSPIVPVFSATNPSQNPDDPYYFVRSYQYFVDLINTALSTAYTLLPDKGSTTQPPYMTYDPVTGLFSMFAEQSYFQNSNPLNTSNLLIWFNHYLQNLFPSFEYVCNGYTPTIPKEEFAIFVKNNNNNTPSSPTGYYQMIQEYPTTFSWNDLQSISFRSNSLPVVFENSTGITTTGETLQGNVSGNQIAFVTDFEPINTGSPGTFQQSIQYYPPGEYRLTDLAGSTPLSQINIQIYWTDKYGNTHQLYIPPGQSLTMKILFRKKSFYNKLNNNK